ncbi:MAG TPA: aminoglycoside phosphotransferase family protein [Sediminibacterium sp.]
MMETIIRKFGLFEESMQVLPLHQGLINKTWKVESGGNVYILQKINNEVFRQPEAITHNIEQIADYLRETHPGYFFTAPVRADDGRAMVYEEGMGYFRMFPFVQGSHTKDTVKTPEEAYEAAKQFGKFTAVLRNFDHARLRTTIPSFHDLGLRYRQFQEALEHGNSERIRESQSLIILLKQHSGIVTEFEKIRQDPAFRLRVTHHDTKISNVLFDENDKGMCVIDLDTVMPGYFISDVGDMMRTYLCPVSEEEADLGKIEVRPDFYHAIVDGYQSEMSDALSTVEKQYFFYAGSFLIYMQALRFMTDYLNNDIYYRSAYPGQNLVRTANQVRLLQCLLALQPATSKAAGHVTA